MLKNDLLKSEISFEHIAVLEALPMPAALFSASADILCANELYKHHFQSSLKEMVLTRLNLLEVNSNSNVSEFDMRCLEMQCIEPFMHSENDRYYWLTLKPHFQQSGELKHVLLCCADITNLKQLEQNLQKHNFELKQQVYFDHLTGVRNRRCFDLHVDEWQQKLNGDQILELCFIMLDLDNFKQVNDQYGHVFGDQVLADSAGILSDVIKHVDFAQIYRLGGEEFAIALPSLALTKACQIAQQCCEQLFASSKYTVDPAIQLSVSCGVAAWQNSELLMQTLNRADDALYQAKHANKNCTFYMDGHSVRMFKPEI